MKHNSPDVTASLMDAMKELQERHPDAGFILIGLSEDLDETEVSLSYNVDDDTLVDLLVEVASDKDDSFPASPAAPSSRMLH